MRAQPLLLRSLRGCTACRRPGRPVHGTQTMASPALAGNIFSLDDFAARQVRLKV